MSPFDDLVGVWLELVTADRVVAGLEVREALLQPTGIVHGGVYATLAESVASIAANVWIGEAAPPGVSAAVGVSNHTDFIAAVRDGALHAEATPLQRGRSLQLWRVELTGDDGRRVAHSLVKLANLSG